MTDVLQYVDGQRAVRLTQEFVTMRTTNPPANEARLAALVLERAQEMGLEGEVLPVAEDRSNVVLRIPGQGGRPQLAFCGHLDTVQVGETPWQHDPFGGTIEDGRIWGRGSCDMKGGVAAMIVAMSAIHASGLELDHDLVFIGLVGEEVDCLGAQAYLDGGGMNDVVGLVIGEPTNLQVAPAHKGALRLELTVRGRSAHGAMPESGTNAIDHLIEVLAAVRGLDLGHADHPLLSPPTMSLNRIDGGFRTNIVPDVCRATLDIRTLPTQDQGAIVDRVRALAAQATAGLANVSFELEVIQAVPSVETPDDHPLVQAMLSAGSAALPTAPGLRGVAFFSDASIFQPATGVPTVLFGPGDDNVAHQVDEHVEVDSIVDAARAFAVLPTLDWAGDRTPARTVPSPAPST